MFAPDVIACMFLDLTSRNNPEPVPPARLASQPFTAFSTDPNQLFNSQAVATSSQLAAAPIGPQLPPSQQREALRSFIGPQLPPQQPQAAIGPQLPPQQAQAAIDPQLQRQQSLTTNEQTGKNINVNIKSV